MKKKPSLLTILLYINLFALISSLIFIYNFQKKLGPELIKSGENQVKYIENLIINNSIRKYLKENQNISFIKRKDTKLIEYDITKINNASIKITEIIENDLKKMIAGNLKDIDLKINTITQEYYEKINNGIIFIVSLGSATGNSLLANIGPQIPLKLKLVGDTKTEIKSEVKEYGLNNAMIEIYAKITTSTIIQMPFLSKKITITNKIPLTIEIIQGTLPEYYIGNRNT